MAHNRNEPRFNAPVNAQGASFGSGNVTNNFGRDPVVTPEPTRSASTGPFSGTAKRRFAEGLVGDWRSLADVLEVPPDEVYRFEPGRGPESLWEWLQVRARLAVLPAALRDVGRDDLADMLEVDRHRRA